MVINNSYNIKDNSKNISKGSIFCTINGKRINGELFIEDAISRGASYIIVKNKYQKINNYIK